MRQLPDPATLPCGPLEETSGIAYFPRMTGKIRLHAEGMLWEDLQTNLGKGIDATLLEFLRIDYEALRARVLEGGDDGEILAWCEAQGRPLNDADKRLWNYYVAKLGWNDHISDVLATRKKDAGLEDRDDIHTIVHYIDIDEGRRD